MGKNSSESRRYQCRAGATGLTIALLIGSMVVCAVAGASQSQVGSALEANVVPAESAESTCTDAAGLSFVPVSLEDLRRAESLTVVQDTGGPGIAILEICNTVDGYRDFEPNPSHEFPRSLFGRAWLYAEIDGIGMAAHDDDTYHISLSADVVVLDQQQHVVWQKKRAFLFEEEFQSPAYGVYAYVYVPTIFLSKGEYNIEITINDNIEMTTSRVNTLIRIK